MSTGDLNPMLFELDGTTTEYQCMINVGDSKEEIQQMTQAGAEAEKLIDFDTLNLKVGKAIGKGYNSWYWSRCLFTGEAFKVSLDGGACALGLSDTFVSRTSQRQEAKSVELGRPLRRTS